MELVWTFLGRHFTEAKWKIYMAVHGIISVVVMVTLSCLFPIFYPANLWCYWRLASSLFGLLQQLTNSWRGKHMLTYDCCFHWFPFLPFSCCWRTTLVYNWEVRIAFPNLLGACYFQVWHTGEKHAGWELHHSVSDLGSCTYMVTILLSTTL